MHDEVAVRVRDRGEHVEEQPHARFDVETALLRIAIDALAVDVLEHEVRLTARRDAGIDQLRDVRMPELREHRSFAHEACSAGRPSSAAFSSLTARGLRSGRRCVRASQTLPMPP